MTKNTIIKVIMVFLDIHKSIYLTLFIIFHEQMKAPHVKTKHACSNIKTHKGKEKKKKNCSSSTYSNRE